MSYTFGARLDDDSFALTAIDEDQGTAVTKGEINGVPFESRGGGGGGDGGLVGYENGELDKNYNELMAMVESGTIPWIIDVLDESPEITTNVLPVTRLYTDGSNYMAYFACIDVGNNPYAHSFIASSATGTFVLD